MRRDLFRILLNCLLVFMPPLLLLGGVYVAIDPFRVLRDYDVYYPEPPVLQPTINKGMISVANFERGFPEHNYNAFIMGSSVSIAYPVSGWARHLPPGARPFHFDSAMESVHSLRLKLEYLERMGADISNVLLVIPPQWFEFADSEAPPFVDPPAIDTSRGKVAYHWLFVKGFYNREFFKAYVMARLMGRAVSVGTVNAIDPQRVHINPLTNEETSPVLEDSIRYHAREFYRLRDLDASRGHPHRLEPRADAASIADLEAIVRLLHRHNTDYRVVMAPVLSGAMPAESDLEVLRNAFGDRFYDFTVTMRYKTLVDTNYYDGIHYRYPVALEIMDSVYSPRPVIK